MIIIVCYCYVCLIVLFIAIDYYCYVEDCLFDNVIHCSWILLLFIVMFKIVCLIMLFIVLPLSPFPSSSYQKQRDLSK